MLSPFFTARVVKREPEVHAPLLGQKGVRKPVCKLLRLFDNWPLKGSQVPLKCFRGLQFKKRLIKNTASEVLRASLFGIIMLVYSYNFVHVSHSFFIYFIILIKK